MLALCFFPAPDRKTEIPKVRRSEFWWLLFFVVAMFALYAFAYWLGPPNPFVPAKAGGPRPTDFQCCSGFPRSRE